MRFVASCIRYSSLSTRTASCWSLSMRSHIARWMYHRMCQKWLVIRGSGTIFSIMPSTMSCIFNDSPKLVHNRPATIADASCRSSSSRAWMRTLSRNGRTPDCTKMESNTDIPVHAHGGARYPHVHLLLVAVLRDLHVQDKLRLVVRPFLQGGVQPARWWRGRTHPKEAVPVQHCVQIAHAHYTGWPPAVEPQQTGNEMQPRDHSGAGTVDHAGDRGRFAQEVGVRCHVHCSQQDTARVGLHLVPDVAAAQGEGSPAPLPGRTPTFLARRGRSRRCVQ
jgi:hypothetical protein